MTAPIFDPLPILKYLSLPSDHDPSPEKDPIAFLRQNIQNLPPGLLTQFSIILTPRERTGIVAIKNRRTTWSTSYEGLKGLGWQQARKEDPIAYETYMIAASGSRGAPLATAIDPGAPQREVRRGEEEAAEERDWAENHFLGGASEYRKHVGDGRFAKLLGGFEEEREAERHRELRAEARRKEQEEQESFQEEEDEDEDEDEPSDQPQEALETPEEARQSFEKIIREKYIAGLLDWMDYDAVDYDDQWDAAGRDDEERWFDDEEAD